MSINLEYSRPQNKKPKIPTVQIVVEDGIATVTRKDSGVKVILVDKDGEQVGEGTSRTVYNSWEKVKKDKQNGN